MENQKFVIYRHLYFIKCLIFLIFFFPSIAILAQENTSISGKVIQFKNQQAIPYATITLYQNKANSTELISGTISNDDGEFSLNQADKGAYQIRVSSIGYKTAIKEIEIISKDILDIGIISLKDSTQLMDELIVVGDRIKGKTENEKNIYYMNKSIRSASGNTPDLLRYVPGIQVDLKQNISIHGKTNILLFVNGQERDKSYLSRLNPTLIDRVEIINTPPVNYDGDASAVINIVLKKEQVSGVSGHIFTEVPTSKSIVYSYPTFNIQYGLKKMTLFTSYSGEINYEDIDEIYKHQIKEGNSSISINAIEKVRQKNLSHKFHYGFDYHITPKDVINYYGSVNPYSYEQDGKVIVDINENKTRNSLREETDKNLNVFNSLFYKHSFNKKGSEITIDISNSILKSSSEIHYFNIDEDSIPSLINTNKPRQIATSLKIDYTTPIKEKLKLSSGIKSEIKSMQNAIAKGFGYNEQIYAFYGALRLSKKNYNFNFGMRTELAKMKLKNDFNKTMFSVLPYLSFQYKINTRQNLLISYKRSLTRPSVFQLNPYFYLNNIYSVSKGNPKLEPEFINRLSIEHSISFDVSYISYRLFYENTNNAINKLTILNEDTVLETQIQNLGNIHKLGVQFLGSLKFGPLTFSPNVSVYHQSTFANPLAKKYGVENKDNWIFDAGFSSVFSIKNDISISGTFQYSTKKYNIQNNTYSNALYILSLDKTFNNKLQLGLMFALPFAKNFVYEGSEIEAQNFSSHHTGNLKLPAVPVMFRIRYQFSFGKEKSLINREIEDITRRPKSGF